MAVLDHFGYKTQPIQDYDDPLWFDRDGFIAWLEHIKDHRRLHMIKDPSVRGEKDKNFQVTSEKIKADLGAKVRKGSSPRVKSERDDSSPESPPAKLRKPKPKKDSKESKKTKVPKGASHVHSDSEPEATPSGTKSRPSTGGKSPRAWSKVDLKASSRRSSDIDTDSSETEG